MIETLLSLKTTASLLGVHEQTLRKWDKEGKLCAIRTPGGHRRYRTSDIETFYNSDIIKKQENAGNEVSA